VPKPKYFEVVLVSQADALFPSHSLAGYSCVSDYLGEHGRHLFFRKPESAVAPKPRKPRTKKTGKQTEFPGAQTA
jgi:hypothetical protein